MDLDFQVPNKMRRSYYSIKYTLGADSDNDFSRLSYYTEEHFGHILGCEKPSFRLQPKLKDQAVSDSGKRG